MTAIPITIATWNVNGIRARHAQVQVLELVEPNIGWRLDYVLASEPVARMAGSCAVLRQFGTSDHRPVVAAFDGV